ncbi:MAG TPA: SIS domain-containing protein [Candidatus Solibacter sp.]|nr:SIS domain-containing protein [Candidatus Solibacter sp.]
MPSPEEFIRAQLEESCHVKHSFSPELVALIAALAARIVQAVRAGGKVILFGNGGSAADAQHLAAEFVVRLRDHRPPIAAIALTVNTSVLTAAANDFGYEQVFSRQVEALARPGDVILALSTSGASANVLLGAEMGRARGAWVAALTGESGGGLRKRSDLLINVPSQDAQRIQEAHITIGHILCALVEQHLKSAAPR